MSEEIPERIWVWFRPGENPPTIVWTQYQVDADRRSWPEYVSARACSAQVAALTARLEAAEEANATAIRILKPIADEMMLVQHKADYRYRTSSGGRACLDAYNVLSALAPPATETP